MWKLRVCFFPFPPQEGNSLVASQGVVVAHFTVPSFLRDKSPTQWQCSDTAQGYCSVLEHFMWQKVGGTWAEPKRASARDRRNICCSCSQEHPTHEEQEQLLWAQSWQQSPHPFSRTTPGSAGLHSEKLQSADQRHHSTHCFSLSKTLLNHSTSANWALQANNIKALQKVLWFFFSFFILTWHSMCQYDKQSPFSIVCPACI